MIKYIRTSVILAITIINFIGIIIYFISLSKYYENTNVYKRKLQIIPTNFITKLDNNINLDNTSHNKLRKLKQYSSFYYKRVLILNLLFIYFGINLIISFCIGEYEFENQCCNCNCNSGWNFNLSRNNYYGHRSGAVIFIFILLVFVLMVGFIKFCGKHLSRYISILFVICINFIILILSLDSKEIKNKSVKINIINSLFLFLLNILVIIFPNLKNFKIFTYKFNRSPTLINYPQTQISQITNNVTINNNIQNINKNNEINNPAPLPNFNTLESKKSENINAVLNKSNNDSKEINNKRNLNNSDLGIPPLPLLKIESKKEIIP